MFKPEKTQFFSLKHFIAVLLIFPASAAFADLRALPIPKAVPLPGSAPAPAPAVGGKAPATTTSLSASSATTLPSSFSSTAAVPTKGLRSDEIIAQFETNMGIFKVRLFRSVAPQTVDHFVGLVKGTKEWVDPRTNKMVRRPFYDGLSFFRVTNEYIATGDPTGFGMGGPGYYIKDEISSDLKHVKGTLSMISKGPNTNGSQFMISLKDAHWLNGKRTIFGQVIEGMNVIDSISKVPVSAGRPVNAVTVLKVRIL